MSYYGHTLVWLKDGLIKNLSKPDIDGSNPSARIPKYINMSTETKTFKTWLLLDYKNSKFITLIIHRGLN